MGTLSAAPSSSDFSPLLGENPVCSEDRLQTAPPRLMCTLGGDTPVWRHCPWPTPLATVASWLLLGPTRMYRCLEGPCVDPGIVTFLTSCQLPLRCFLTGEALLGHLTNAAVQAPLPPALLRSAP